jgi:hypothetical protein
VVTRVLREPIHIEALANLLRARKLPMTVHISAGADRTGQQNALAFAWYLDIARDLGDRTASDVRAHCKLYHGVKLLHTENEPFREAWNRLIKDRFTLEEKLELMLPPHDYPVTRLMRVKQMTAYLDGISREFSAQGVRLTDPEALRYQQEFYQ